MALKSPRELVADQGRDFDDAHSVMGVKVRCRAGKCREQMVRMPLSWRQFLHVCQSFLTVASSESGGSESGNSLGGRIALETGELRVTLEAVAWGALILVVVLTWREMETSAVHHPSRTCTPAPSR
jgi:hypothetical protein